MNTEIKISGAILCGGENKRMGRDKASLLYNGKTMVEILSGKLCEGCDEIFLVSNNEAHSDFGISCYPDIIKHKGPAGGIYTSLEKARFEYCLIIGCDMPFLNKELFSYLKNFIDEKYDVLIPVLNEKAQPLCSIYSRKCKDVFKDASERNDLKLISIIEKLNKKYIDIGKDLEFYTENLFANINTAEDYKNLTRQDVN